MSDCLQYPGDGDSMSTFATDRHIVVTCIDYASRCEYMRMVPCGDSPHIYWQMVCEVSDNVGRPGIGERMPKSKTGFRGIEKGDSFVLRMRI